MVLFKQIGLGAGGPVLPSALRQQAQARRGEKVLASGRVDGRDAWLVATNWSMVEFVDGHLALRKDWHEVDRGVWAKDTARLTVTWTDGTARRIYPMSEGPGNVLEALHERVQASVVLSETVEVPQAGSAQVAIRRDLQSGEIFDQVLSSTVTSAHDPELLDQIRSTRNRLRDQVGLPPVPAGDAECGDQ